MCINTTAQFRSGYMTTQMKLTAGPSAWNSPICTALCITDLSSFFYKLFKRLFFLPSPKLAVPMSSYFEMSYTRYYILNIYTTETG